MLYFLKCKFVYFFFKTPFCFFPKNAKKTNRAPKKNVAPPPPPPPRFTPLPSTFLLDLKKNCAFGRPLTGLGEFKNAIQKDRRQISAAAQKSDVVSPLDLFYRVLRF
jgi:hypothetical protein